MWFVRGCAGLLGCARGGGVLLTSAWGGVSALASRCRPGAPRARARPRGAAALTPPTPTRTKDPLSRLRDRLSSCMLGRGFAGGGKHCRAVHRRRPARRRWPFRQRHADGDDLCRPGVTSRRCLTPLCATAVSTARCQAPSREPDTWNTCNTRHKYPCLEYSYALWIPKTMTYVAQGSGSAGA